MASAGVVKAAKKSMGIARRETIAMYLFLAPAIIGFFWFWLYPTITTLVMSFFNWDAAGNKTFIGIDNFIRMATTDKLFPISVRVTVTFTLVSVTLNMILGFVIASMLNQSRKSVGVFRTIYYIPCMIAAGAPAMITWKWIFSQEGMLNTMLKRAGVTGPNWLNDTQFALSAIIIMSVWGVGSIMIIFISGLKAIPDEFYESAVIDGAGYFRKMFSITLPMLSPTILYNLIMGIIGALQSFTAAFVLTRGGPRYQTTFYALNVYNQAFLNLSFGYASALAWVLFVAVMLLTLLIFKTSARWVFYGDGMDSEKRKGKR